MIVKIFSFNLLSEVLCNRRTFPSSSKTSLNVNKRLSLIDAIVRKMINDNYIICLQEVSPLFEEYLYELFEKHKYEFICENYSNCMGTAIAYSSDWTLKSSKIIDPSFFKVSKSLKNKYPWLCATISNVSYIQNRFPLLELAKDDVTIAVCSIHMPCRYDDEELMSTYYALIIGEICENAHNVIIVGDLNSDRKSDLYSLITTGKTKYKDIINSSLYQPVVFKDCFRDQIIYTCNSHTRIKNRDNKYKDVIDYILVDSNMKVIESSVYPQDDKLLPNYTHPSDHCYITVTLEI